MNFQNKKVYDRAKLQYRDIISRDPQYADAIEPARERLSKSNVQTRASKGAATRNVRSIEELREEKAALKQAS